MIRCFSTDSFFKINEKKRLFLIKQSRCKKINKYKTGALISGSVLLVYSNIYKDITYETFGSILTTSYFLLDLGFNYVENYINQLDEWRESEAKYEEKTDPPEWNWKIVNQINHLVVVLNLLSCISIDFSEINDIYFYIGNVLQLISIYLKLKNEKWTKKIIITSGMNIFSMILFILNNLFVWCPFVILATYMSVVAQIIEL
jgi:hypothetical protein